MTLKHVPLMEDIEPIVSGATIDSATIETFKTLLKMNAIRSCPVTTEDVNIAEKIFGPNMSSLKGKSTRQKSTPVQEYTIEIPEELIENNREIELCIDNVCQ
jgi:hypothetical protein